MHAERTFEASRTCGGKLCNESHESLGSPTSQRPILPKLRGRGECRRHDSEKNAVFGGEGNGGPIEPRVGWVRDSFVGMAYVLEWMATQGKSLSQLVQAIPATTMIKSKMELSGEKLAASVEKLQSGMKAESISTLDGVRLAWSDRWILLRGSNTEPIVRLIAEAPTKSAAEELIRSAQSIIEA